MIQKLKLNKWIWILSALIVLLLVFAIVKSKTKPKGEAVILEKSLKRDITEKVSASGKIFPETEIKISSDVSGEVVELFVEEGDSVKAGQILARVNPDAYQSAVERGSAGVSTARSQAAAMRTNIQSSIAQKKQIQAQWENAKKILERNQQLLKDGIISQAELETAETQYKNLESNLASADAAIQSAIKQAEAAGFQVSDAEAMLKEQRTNLGRTTIKAPASGIVSKLNIEKGERVVGTMQMSGTELMRIADLNAMEVQVEVSENDIVRVIPGNEADIEVEAYLNKKFKGRVTEVGNSAANIGGISGVSLSTDQVSKFIVKVRIDKSSYADLIRVGKPAPFKPGMSATVEISTTSAKGVLSIPIQAVTAYDQQEEEKKKLEKLRKDNPNYKYEDENIPIIASTFKEAVFVKLGDTVARRDIVTGIQDENYIEILSGLEEGEEIVIGPYLAISKKLKNGTKVHRKKEDKKDKDQDKE